MKNPELVGSTEWASPGKGGGKWAPLEKVLLSVSAGFRFGAVQAKELLLRGCAPCSHNHPRAQSRPKSPPQRVRWKLTNMLTVNFTLLPCLILTTILRSSTIISTLAMEKPRFCQGKWFTESHVSERQNQNQDLSSLFFPYTAGGPTMCQAVFLVLRKP